MKFKNRIEAAKLLLSRLSAYKGQNPLVVGIPRGAMPMAKIITDGLQGELDAVLVHKIPHPWSHELAIGSIGISGHVHLLRKMFYMNIPETYIDAAAAEQLETLKQRQKKFGLKTPRYKGRLVILVDDGIATGATTLGAIHEIKQHKPKKLIMAAAVCAPDTAQKIKPLVDEFVVLDTPDPFFAVGEFFEDFTEVTDDDVVRILQGEQKHAEISL